MSADDFWWITLGLGFVAAVAAVGLLHSFLVRVRRVEAAAAAIWDTGKQVAANTANTWLLAEVSGRLDEIAAEAGRHEELLSARGDGVAL